MPIAGFAIKENKLDGIYVGRQKGDALLYAEKVDHGFDTAKILQARLRPLICKAIGLEGAVSKVRNSRYVSGQPATG